MHKIKIMLIIMIFFLHFSMFSQQEFFLFNLSVANQGVLKNID